MAKENIVVYKQAAQGGTPTNDTFDNHIVVRLGSATSHGVAIYDPSYGRYFIGEQEWRDAMEKYLEYTSPNEDPNGGTPLQVQDVAHGGGKVDTQFLPS